jgi:amidase
MQELTITAIQKQMATGTLTARAIVASYLARIEQIDSQLGSVIAVNPDAEEVAASLDAEREAQGPRGPLHGIPILLKDNIVTAGPLPTTAGSLALKDYYAAKDAFVARRLRAAGAIILGKTNLSEWANFRSTRSSSGWSSVGGQTRNPYALDRNPCGSSSGSAVAVSANLCAAAVGTETNGSIICPAQANGIVGLKPTVGLVSRSGIVPIAHSQDTAGPMGRTVRDVALLLAGMVGSDPEDAATAASDRHSAGDYTQYLEAGGLEGTRLGVARNLSAFHPETQAILETAADTLQDLGAAIADPANVETAGDLRQPQLELLLYEFKADLNAFLATLDPAPPVHSLADLIAFNEAHAATVMPFFGQELFVMAQAKGGLEEEAYQAARRQARRLARAEGIDATLAKHDLDAIIALSGGPAWLTDWVTGDHFGGSSSGPAAIAGYPNITVPAGTVFGLPIGISFFSSAFEEPLLLRLAYAFEQATQARQLPSFRETLRFNDPAKANA